MITGNKIELQALEPEHLAQANAWINDPDIRKYLTLYQPIPLRASKKWYEQTCDDPNAHVFAIVTNRGRFIGTLGLHAIDWKNRNAEMGIAIGHKQALGRGYGEDAITTLLGFAFGELGLNRIHLRVWAYNERAIACYERCGFQHEGVMRQFLFRDGAFHDALCMGILSQEFVPRETPTCPRKK